MHADTYSSASSVKNEEKKASLVGESCLIDYQFNVLVTSLLLDTGAQVSIIDMEDLKNYHSNTVVRSLEEILDGCDHSVISGVTLEIYPLKVGLP